MTLVCWNINPFKNTNNFSSLKCIMQYQLRIINMLKAVINPHFIPTTLTDLLCFGNL